MEEFYTRESDRLRIVAGKLSEKIVSININNISELKKYTDVYQNIMREIDNFAYILRSIERNNPKEDKKEPKAKKKE